MSESIVFHRRYLDALADRVVVFDGAMGTSLQKMNLSAADFGGEHLRGCNDHLVLSKPEAIEQVHASFLQAGCDVVETCTFRANRITMQEYGLQEHIVEMNRRAAALARAVADRFSTAEKPRFVAGSIGPTGKLPSTEDPGLSDITFDELIDVVRQQAVALIEGGCDLLLIETSQDMLEVKASVIGAQRAFRQIGRRLPLQVQVTLDTGGRMLLGTDIGAVLATLEHMGVDVIGLNCSTGPEHMRPAVRYLCEHSCLPISCVPNAGLPLNVDGRAVYPLDPAPFAAELAEFVTGCGVAVVGGCCGTTPEHIAALAQRVAGLPAPRRQRQEPSPMVSSAMSAVGLQQTPPPMLIGERLNTQGSKKMKEMVLAEDFDGMLALAREQVEGGAHTLDICLAMTEHSNEAQLMSRLVKKLSLGVEAPLVIDTTEAEVLEAALQAAPGRIIVNAINMENGRARIDAMVPLIKEHGAAVIALTIDEKGMARTVDRKLEAAGKIYDIVVGEYGLSPDSLIFDALTFTLATGDTEFADSALQTLEGIRRIKARYPGVLTSLGVSNVSFGFKPAARLVLNSVFLYHAVQAGLDMAIVNAKQITPYAEIPAEQRELADDLLFNRRADASARFITHFEGVKAKEAQAVDVTAAMSPEERVHWSVLHRRKEGVNEALDLIMDRLVLEACGRREFRGQADFPYPNAVTSKAAVWILNHVLLPAMKEVGDKFGAGELILPFVLQSAEVMKLSVEHLETYLERSAGVSKGKVVLATVYGDVHDIGKNLVKTILVNNGYTVFDLGKQVPVAEIVAKAIEVGADAVGLSALLVSTSRQMPLVVREMHQRGLQIPVLVGGAAINRQFGQRISFVEENLAYPGGVCYCKDAFEALETMDQIQDPARRSSFIAALHQAAAAEQARPAPTVAAPAGRSAVAGQRVPVPTPPAWGMHKIDRMALESVFAHLDKAELFRLSWGARGKSGDEWRELEAQFEQRLQRMKKEAIMQRWFAPQALYGYWPVQSAGEELIVYDPAAPGREILRFHFPRQRSGEFLCLADYFAPKESGIMDTAAFQVVTVGVQATARFDAMQARDEYSESYFFHGLAVQTAEATAEYVHRHIRRELGLEEHRGKRYSWGFPAIPEIRDHEKLFRLLPAEAELGMKLTEAWQLVPEQSTAAIVVHHPAAQYFSTR